MPAARRPHTPRPPASARRSESRPASSARRPCRSAPAGWRRGSRPDCRWSVSTNRSLEIELTPVVRAMAGRRAALASSIAIERRGDAPLGGDHVRPPFEQLGRQPGGNRVRLAGQLRADGRAAAPDSGRAGSRARGSPVRARARSAAGCRGTSRRPRGRRRRLRRCRRRSRERVSASRTSSSPSRMVPRATSACKPGFDGEKPALGDERGERLPRVLEIRLRRRGVGGAAARPYRTRPQRSSSQFTDSTPPCSPELSPDILPPPRARRSTDG